MKKLFAVIFLALVVAAGVYTVQGGFSKTKSYYAGDAVYHDGQVLVLSTNTGKLEIFRADKASLKRITATSPIGSGFDTFNNAIFSQENGRLFIYATSGATLYKYDAGDPTQLGLLASTKDTSWDWFGRVERVDGRLVTIGSKAVKIWNNDLQVVDSYNVINTTNPYNVRLSVDGRFIFNLHDNVIEIFDRESRSNFRTITLSNHNEKGNKQLYYDNNAQMIYVIDDSAIKRFGLDGGLYKSLAHDSRFGYDVIKSSNAESLYISNGTSIAKISPFDFKIKAAFENRAAKLNTSWAMGLVAVPTPSGDKVVVFNNDTIVLLDSNLKLESKALATDQVIDKEVPREALALFVDKNKGLALSPVALSGQGYLANETLDIYFADSHYFATTDKSGRFSTTVYVPTITKSKTDIKVSGQRSLLSYSTSFTIIQIEN